MDRLGHHHDQDECGGDRDRLICERRQRRRQQHHASDEEEHSADRGRGADHHVVEQGHDIAESRPIRVQCPSRDVAAPGDLETHLAQTGRQGPCPERHDAQHADPQEDGRFNGEAPHAADPDRGHREPDGHEKSLEREGKRQIQGKGHQPHHDARRTPHQRLASDELR